MTDNSDIRHFDGRCKECFCSVSRDVWPKLGRYLVHLPTTCPHKDQCEKNLMQGYESKPDVQQPN